MTHLSRRRKVEHSANGLPLRSRLRVGGGATQSLSFKPTSSFLAVNRAEHALTLLVHALTLIRYELISSWWNYQDDHPGFMETGVAAYAMQMYQYDGTPMVSLPSEPLIFRFARCFTESRPDDKLTPDIPFALVPRDQPMMWLKNRPPNMLPTQQLYETVLNDAGSS